MGSEGLEIALLFFLLPLLFWDGFADASNTPKWIVLSALLPLILLFRDIPWTKCHRLGAIFLGWCSLTALWAVSGYEAVHQLWLFGVLGLCFVLGSTLESPRGCLIGFAWGVSVNALILIFQDAGASVWWGYPGTLRYIVQAVEPAGLLMNKNFVAEASLLAAVGCIWARHWYPLPLLAIGIYLPQSKGVWVAAGLVAVYWVWQRSRLGATVLLCLIIGAAAASFPTGGKTTFGGRLALYANSIEAIKEMPFGHGIGSFWSAYPDYHEAVIPTPEIAYGFHNRPQTAHNDLLTLGVETGVIGIGLFLALVFSVPRSGAFPVVLAFLAVGLFAFPLYLPITACLAAVVAGSLSRSRGEPRRLRDAWRDAVCRGKAALGRQQGDLRAFRIGRGRRSVPDRLQES